MTVKNIYHLNLAPKLLILLLLTSCGNSQQTDTTNDLADTTPAANNSSETIPADDTKNTITALDSDASWTSESTENNTIQETPPSLPVNSQAIDSDSNWHPGTTELNLDAQPNDGSETSKKEAPVDSDENWQA